MLYHKSFVIAFFIVALVLFSFAGYSEDCDKSSDIDSGWGENTWAFGHAEIVLLGFWDGNCDTTGWGYVTDDWLLGNIYFSARYEFKVHLKNANGTFSVLFNPPIQWSGYALDPGATGSSTYTMGYSINERLLKGRTLRGEARAVVSASRIDRPDIQDEWEARGCVEARI